MSHASARRLVGIAVATSTEAEELLHGVPQVLRSLSVSTTNQPVRCDGEIRGPVLWSATMAARSASPGAGGVFICASPTKAYDTDENRVLVAALSRIIRAAWAADPPGLGGHDDLPPEVRRAIHNGDRARRALEHRSLQAVSRAPLSGRAVHKARTGTKAAVFRTAVDVVQLTADLRAYVDEPAAAALDLAADVADRLAARGELPHALLLTGGRLVGGRFAYTHGTGVSVDDRPIVTVDQL